MTIATDQLPALVATSANPFDLPQVPSDATFDDRNADFLPAPEVQRIGGLLCQQRTQLQVSDQVRVEYLYKRKGGVSGGKAVLGKCIKTSGLVKHFASDTRHSAVDYVIWIAADAVRTLRMANWQLEALIYHELLHIAVETDDNDQEKLSTRGHDYEGFNDEIDAYGLWWTDLQAMGSHVRQLKLSGLESANDRFRVVADDLKTRGVDFSFSGRA